MAPTEGDYLRVLSHQLKSPITSIQSLLQTVADGFAGEVDAKTLYLIGRALRRADEATEMISDLLDFEAMREGSNLARAELDLVTELNALIGNAASAASEKGVTLHAAIPLDLTITVEGDSRALAQAFRNLIENAVKYTSSGGHVHVDLEPKAKQSTCVVLVRDTGMGIPADEIEAIFEPFHRSRKHRSTISGTGLGLPIARRIVDAHGGSIAAESVEDQGTTFTVTLPCLRIDRTAAPRTPRRRVVIVGGVTAGPKTAARLRRLDEEVEIVVVERSEFLAYAGCGLPNYLSGQVSSPKALMSTADNAIRNVHFFESIKNIKIHNNTVAHTIDRERCVLLCWDQKQREEIEIPYDTLVLATGTRPTIPDIPGIDVEGVYSLYSLDAAEAMKRELAARPSPDVYIIGGGLIGISMAEGLVEAGTRVTVIEKRERILSNYFDPDIADKIADELSRKGIRIVPSTALTRIERRDGLLSLETSRGANTADLVILAAGVVPRAELARDAGLEIGPSGGIQVNEQLRTSDERIYAVGDCAETVNLITGRHEYLPLGSVSTKMGRLAADAIAGRSVAFQGSIGTAMFRIFDVNAARTGLTAELAEERGFDAETVVITGLDRPHYTPGAAYVCIKVIADRTSRRLLGAQGFGRGNVVERIRILAGAISQSLTLPQIFALDLGYNPAYSMAIDIAQTACLVLENKIDDLLESMPVSEFRDHQEELHIVDVSPLSEYTEHSIPGSINIPLENVRREEIPFERGEKVVLYSNTSSSAYEALRLLTSRGYTNLQVLEGGYRCWRR